MDHALYRALASIADGFDVLEIGARTSVTPLCVDLESALVLSDLLLESLLLLIKRNPFYLLCIPLWLLRGKNALKTEIATRVELNPAALPYNREFIDWLRSEHLAGRTLWLCTEVNERLAQNIAAHLRLFDGVIASDNTTNRAGTSTAARLIEHFGERGFDYCGNGERSLAIWQHAHGAIVTKGVASLECDAARETSVLFIFRSRISVFRTLVRALRPHQWSKNALILVPLLAAHIVSDSRAIAAALLALVAFCAGASSVYVLNDLLDLEADRAHPRKASRPFAAGELPILMGLAIAPILLGSAVFIAVFLPAQFQLAFTTYYLLSLAYLFVLKERVLIDALALAGLYTLRIIAGAAAVGVPLSFWLLLLSLFLFLSLALVKRFAELDAMRQRKLLRAEGRGYHAEDLPLLQSLGVSSGYLAVLVLGLYINSPAIEALYRRPKEMWMLCVLMLYWISRVWMTAQRGAMHDDPVVFALRDRVSLVVGILAAITVVTAI